MSGSQPYTRRVSDTLNINKMIKDSTTKLNESKILKVQKSDRKFKVTSRIKDINALKSFLKY